VQKLNMADDDKINWNVDLEVGLFHAMHAHRPVGRCRFLVLYLYLLPVTVHTAGRVHSVHQTTIHTAGR